MAYTELNVVLAQKHGMAAEQRDGRLCRHARAGAALAEHHGDRLAGHAVAERGRRLTGLDLGLARGAIADEVGEFGGCEVRNGHEMPGRGG